MAMARSSATIDFPAFGGATKMPFPPRWMTPGTSQSTPELPSGQMREGETKNGIEVSAVSARV